MTSDEIRAFVRRHVEAWRKHDIAALMKGYADGCELVSPLFRIVRGKAEIEASFKDVFRVFGDLEMRLDDVLIDHDAGDRAAMVCTIIVTHLGDVLGFRGTGRRVTVNGVFMLSFKDGRIASTTGPDAPDQRVGTECGAFTDASGPLTSRRAPCNAGNRDRA